MEQMKPASRRGTPPMRPLFFDYPGDNRCQTIDDQFLFGPDILVAPVLASSAKKRNVYLPAGENWMDAWTGKKFKGGQTIAAPAPLETIPVFLRAVPAARLMPLFRRKRK